jgi:aldehyde oxidoreductase
MALMEEFIPGRGENLHDYLIPTIGDIPPMDRFWSKALRPWAPLAPRASASRR